MQCSKVMALGVALISVGVAGASAPRGQESKVSTQLQVAELLDRIVEPRFQQDIGIFGMSRMITSVRGHQPVNSSALVAGFNSRNPAESALFAQANALNHDYLVAFLHTTHVPGKSGKSLVSNEIRLPVKTQRNNETVRPAAYVTVLVARNAEHKPVLAGKLTVSSHKPIRQSETRWAFGDKSAAALEKAALEALPRLRKGESVDRSVDRWFVAMRPVRAAQASCINCHVGAKTGDTLGAVIYAIDNAELSPRIASVKR